jgi:hypothetical protein
MIPMPPRRAPEPGIGAGTETFDTGVSFLYTHPNSALIQDIGFPGGSV